MSKNVSILDYGAVPGACGIQTEYFQAAIDDCFKSGGGVVEVPAGEYTVGSIRIRSNITLYLKSGAKLMGSRNPRDYFTWMDDTVEPIASEEITNQPWVRAKNIEDEGKGLLLQQLPGSRWNNGIIRAIDAVNIAVIGEEGSIIDGCNCYDEEGEENYRGPHGLSIFRCKNVISKGFCIQHTGNWSHSVALSSNITIEDITVKAGHDGVHLTVCENIKIKNSKFYTGDDCVAGFANLNMHVIGCELNSACSTMRLGGTNVIVEKCHIYGPCKYLFRGKLTKEEKASGAIPELGERQNNPVSVLTYYADHSFEIEHLPGNMIIKDCKIENADRLMHFNYSGTDRWQRNRPLKSITFENVEAVNLGIPFTAYGDKENPLELTMKNVSIAVSEDCKENEVVHTCNFEKISIDGLTLKNFEGKSIIKKWSDGIISAKNTPEGVNLAEDATEEFTCRTI